MNSLVTYLTRRIAFILVTLVGITLITFFMMKLAPGDPVSLKLMFVGQGISPQALAKELARQEDPLTIPAWYVETARGLALLMHDSDATDTATVTALTWLAKNLIFYGKWVANIAQLDFGLSTKDRRPVLTKIAEALPITLTLNIITILIVYTVSIPLGIWSARKQDSVFDKIVMVKLFILYSLPSFWVATLLLTYLAGGEYLNLFPLTGMASDGAEVLPFWRRIANIAWHLILPITVYVYGSFAFLSRFSRSTFLEVVRQDYIRTARSKGLPERVVIWKHAFRNSLIPFLSLIGTLLPELIGGSVIIENIFSIPGMGRLGFEAVLSRDQNVIMGIEVISAFLTLVSLLLADLCYVWVDPRISFEARQT